MISYHISTEELSQRIEDMFPGNPSRRNGKKSWFERATLESQKGQENSHPIWQELKPIFAQLQGSQDGNKVKCAYCEKFIPLSRTNRLLGEIDHFRPQNGYFFLAYVPRNYVLSCKECNGAKSDTFPINGLKATTANQDELANEYPLLISPLDPIEPLLDTLIAFDGPVALTIASPGTYEEERAMKMLEVFTLNERYELIYQRSLVIRTLYLALIAGVTSVLDSYRTNCKLEHFNCANCYLNLWNSNEAKARQIGEEILAFLRDDCATVATNESLASINI